MSMEVETYTSVRFPQPRNASGQIPKPIKHPTPHIPYTSPNLTDVNLVQPSNTLDLMLPKAPSSDNSTDLREV